MLDAPGRPRRTPCAIAGNILVILVQDVLSGERAYVDLMRIPVRTKQAAVQSEFIIHYSPL